MTTTNTTEAVRTAQTEAAYKALSVLLATPEAVLVDLELTYGEKGEESDTHRSRQWFRLVSSACHELAQARKA